MFIKNNLTTNQNKSKILMDVNSVKKRNLSRVNLSNAVMYCLSPFVVSHRGAFSVSQNNQNLYEFTTTKSGQQKTSLGKLVNKRHLKDIKLILTKFLTIVKEKFALPNFGPKTRDFTEDDLELIKNLVSKNKLDYPKAWAQFYKLTGTNKNTFNS